MLSGWAALRQLACFKYLAQSVFSSPFLSGGLDQDKASMALALSQQQAVTLGKPVLRAQGKIPFPFCLSEDAVKGVFGSLSKAPTKEEVLSQEIWPLPGSRRQEMGCIVHVVSCREPRASGPASLDKHFQDVSDLRAYSGE